MEEIKNTIKAALYERTTSPFWSSFIISWLCWNWKVPYFIFTSDSNLTFSQRSDYLQYLISNKYFTLLLPLISVFFYLFIIEKLSIWVYKIDLKNRTEKKELKAEIEKTERLSIEQSQKIRHENYSLIAENEMHNQKQKEDIEILKSINKNQQKELKEKTDAINSLLTNASSLENSNQSMKDKINKLLFEIQTYNTNQEESFRIHLNNIFEDIEIDILLQKIIKLKNDKKIHEFVEFYNQYVGKPLKNENVDVYFFNMELFTDDGFATIKSTKLGKALFYLLNTSTLQNPIISK